MAQMLRRRLTFSNIVALLALFIALGVGTVYAATRINGKQIKPNSIPGNRLRNGTLTGAQINAATLGIVPSANNANNLDGQSAGTFQHQVRWALVDSAGTVLAQSGGITNSGHDPLGCTPGCDILNFGSSQVGKAIIVTPARGGDTFHFESTFLCGGTANPGGDQCNVPTGVNDTSHILVGGAGPNGLAANEGYYIAVVG